LSNIGPRTENPKNDLSKSPHPIEESNRLPENTATPSKPDQPNGSQRTAAFSGRAAHLGNLSRERMPPLYLLIINEQERLRKSCSKTAAGMGFIVSNAADVSGARVLLKRQNVDLILLDIRSSEGFGHSFFKEIEALHPEIEIVVITPSGDTASAIGAMRNGASDHLQYPFTNNELVVVLERARQLRHAAVSSRRERERLLGRKEMGQLIGDSAAMHEVRRKATQVGLARHPVLIRGETGAGKSLLARSIHFSGINISKPYVVIDCKSLTALTGEGHLFGFVKDAFRGAGSEKAGLLSAAADGTVLLDNVTELLVELQAKLTKSLLQKRVYRLGSTNAEPISARILATTSHDIARMVGKGLFRKDLYSFLNVASIRMPSLRERSEDIPGLIEQILNRLHRGSDTTFSLSEETSRTLFEYPWPGNVREIENAFEYAYKHSSSTVLHLRNFPIEIQEFSGKTNTKPGDSIGPIAKMEEQAIFKAIETTNGEKVRAASILGIGKTTLYRKLKAYSARNRERE
jgi:two-component system response regulator HydG